MNLVKEKENLFGKNFPLYPGTYDEVYIELIPKYNPKNYGSI
jgi:hypothetical protein